MAYAIVIPSMIAATNIDALNRTVVSASPLENGMLLNLRGKCGTSGYSEVWQATWPVTGSLTNIWMALSPEVVDVTDATGTVIYRGINNDPRNFRSSASAVVDAVKLQAGDMLVMSTDAFTGAYATGSGQAFAATEQWQFEWGAADPGNALTVKYIDTTYITIGSGSAIGDHRIPAYRMEVIRN